MLEFSMSTQVKAAPQRTFEVFSDFRSVDRQVRGIKKLEVLTEGPIGKGTKFRETRVMWGKEATEVMEITDFQPGTSYTVGSDSCGARWATIFRFSPENGGTRVDMQTTIKAMSFFAKLMSPLGRLMMGSMKKCFVADIEDLKKVAEGEGKQ